MSTVSVPLPDETLKAVKALVEQGLAENVASLIRKAIRKYVEEEAINAVLKASQEPSLDGDLDELASRL